MLKYLLVFVLAIGSLPVLGQDLDNDHQTQFAWEVKQINEFIERFNNSTSTPIAEYYKKTEGGKVLDREQLIKSLFNTQAKDWILPDVISFIKEATDKKKPKFLDFYSGNWWAHFNCAVVWEGKPETVALTLRLQRASNNGYKWVITDASAKFLRTLVANKKPDALPFRMPLAIDSTTALSPMSHTTDFMRIEQISTDINNTANYFEDPEKLSPQTQQFAQECISSRLKLKSTGSITYNFAQIEGWDIQVKQYNRATNNSGWLISKLAKVSTHQ